MAARGGGKASSENLDYTQMKVPLIDPHKLFGMGDGCAVVATYACLADVVPVYAPGWWEMDCYRELMAPNPFDMEFQGLVPPRATIVRTRAHRRYSVSVAN